MVVFQTAKIVRVVSPVVAVVISFVAASPLLKLQPPKVYPLLVVLAVRDRDAVETLKESADTRVEASLTGTDVASVFPSKTIVGLAAVVAVADVGMATTPAIASSPARKTAVVFLESDMILEFRTVAIGFPSI